MQPISCIFDEKLSKNRSAYNMRSKQIYIFRIIILIMILKRNNKKGSQENFSQHPWNRSKPFTEFEHENGRFAFVWKKEFHFTKPFDKTSFFIAGDFLQGYGRKAANWVKKVIDESFISAWSRMLPKTPSNLRTPSFAILNLSSLLPK